MIKCRKCGNADVVIPRINQLMRLPAVAVIRKPYHL